MAKTKNSENFGSKSKRDKRDVPDNQTNTVSGQPNYAELIKGEITGIGEALASSMASFYVGQSTQGDIKKLKNIGDQNKQRSILGKDSIYSLLNDLKTIFCSNEDIKTSSFLTRLSNIDQNFSEFIQTQNQTQINEDIVKCINGLLELEEKIEKLTDVKSYYETTTTKLFEQIKELKDNKKQELLSAKLNLTLEGFDPNSIQSLIEFSNINFDQTNNNIQNFLIFLRSIEGLESLHLDNAKEQLNRLPELLDILNTNSDKIKDISNKINKSEVENVVSIINNIKNIFTSLNQFSDNSANSFGETIKTIGGFNIILGSLLYSMPLLKMINIFYNDKLINLHNTKRIIGDIVDLFKIINNNDNKITNFDFLRSIGHFDLILGSMIYSSGLIVVINKLFDENSKIRVNLDKTKEIFSKFGTLFNTINNDEVKTMNSQKGKEMIDSLNLLIQINKSIIKNFSKIKKINNIEDNGLDTYINLFKKDGYLYNLFENIKNLKEKINEAQIKQVEEGIISLQTIINTIKTLKADQTTNKNLNDIANILFGKDKDKGNSLENIFNNIKNNVNNSIDISIIDNVGLGVLGIKDIIDTINALQSSIKDPKKLQEGLEDYLEVLEESYKKIKEKFEEIITTGDLADKVKASNKSIREALEDNNETIIKTSSKQEDIKKANISLEGMTSFMISAAIVMSIGALFVMLGGGKFIKAALQFGLSLALFEGMVLLPALLFYQQKTNALEGISAFNSFVITCAMTMLIGSIIYALSGGKLVKNAIAFAITLTIFETLVISPILLFNKESAQALKAIDNFKSFIITTTVIMLIGALFMELLGGKLVINALKFGVALMAFEALVVLPFLLFGKIESTIFEHAKHFTALLIVCTTVMMIGALFTMLGGGKFIKAAYEFGKSLMIFEAMIIAPFLLFNFLRKSVFDGLKAFTSVVMVCTITLLVGALFMNMKNGAYQLAAMEFTLLLMKFEAMIIAPFLLFNIIQKPVFKGLKDFAIVVLVATTTLLIGSLFMTMNNGEMWKYALEFTGVLLAFEIALLLPILGFGELGGKPLENAREFGLFVALCSFSLIIGAFFIKQYGWEPAVTFGVLLGVFIGAMSGVIMWLEHRFKDRKAIEKAEEFGIFILLCSTALVTGALFVNKYGVGPVLAFGGVLVAFVGLMSKVVFGLNKMFESTGGVEKPIALMVAMGTFLMLATGSLALGAWVVDTYGWKALLFVPLLMTFVVGIGAIFALIGLPPLFALIGLGAIAATAMGVALLALTSSIMVVNLLFELDPGGKKIRKNIETLNNDVLTWGIMGTFTLLGLLSPLIIPGGLAAIAIGVAMMALGGSLLIINTCVDKVKDTILGNIGTLSLAILAISGLGLELFAMIIPLTLGLPGLALLNIFSLGLTTSILMMYGSIKAMQSVGGDLTKQIDLITKNLQAFIDIPNKISLGGDKGFLGAIWNGGKLFTLNLMMSDIASIVKNTAYAIREIQSLKFGDEHEFNKIQNKIINILSTMPESFLNVYDGYKDEKGEHKGLKDINQYKIDRIILFSKGISEVISGVAEGVSNMAKLQIPIGWDKNGKAISFRRLNEKDFQLAGDNVAKILTTMSVVLGHLWNNNVNVKIGDFDYTLKGGLHELLDDKDSPFFNMISFSKQIGEVISGVAEGVASMAKLKIPISWDTNGKPTGYKSLKDKDFIDAANNTQIILSTIITAMADLYSDGKRLGGGTKNIFDMEDNWFSEDSPSPIMKVIETSFKISELIGNLGGGIKSIATLQIPTKWDTNGKPIYYETLKPTDFANAGQAVGQIITCIIDALNKESYIENSDDIKKVLEAVLPVSELISGMADGIIKLSSGMIPDKWNDSEHPGKATHYKRLTKTDYIKSGQAIAQIVTCISNALIDAYNGKNGNGGLKSILESDSFKDIVESVASTGDLISNIADSVIKIGSAQIPVYKNGKIDHYDKMNITEAKINLSNIIREIMMATVDSIIKVYNGDPGKNNGLNQLLKDENSPFLQATKGINEIMQSVSIITDSIIKLGSAQIPKYKDGKIDTYESINVDNTITNIKKIFQGEGDNDGLLTVLCTSISKIADDYFNPNDETKNISGAVSSVYNGIHQIMNIVDDVTKIITNIGNLKFPKGFDKDGKPTGYYQIKKDIIDEAKKNIVDVMTSILSIFDISSADPKKTNPLKKYLENNIIDPEHKENIINNLKDTKEIISSLSVIVKEFNTYGEGFTKILKYKGSGVKSEKTISLSVLNDAYLIIKAFNEFNSQFNTDVQQNQNLSKIAGNIETIGSDMIRIIVKVSEISKVIFDNKLSEITKNFNNNSLESSLSIIMNGFGIIYKTMINPSKTNNGKYVLIGNLDRNIINQIGLNISIISSLTNTLINEYINNSKKIENIPDLNTDYTDKLNKIKDFYINIISVIKSINDELLKNVKIQVSEKNNTNQILSTFSDFISNGVNPFDSEMFEKFDNLNTSINDIYESITKQEDHSKEFKSNTNALQAYIKAINTIDIKKINSLASLAKVLYNLANKLGGLDNLTKYLSEELGVVLNSLTEALKDSKTTISDAQKLQKDRHDQINKSINTVRGLLNMPLNVNIKADKNQENGEPDYNDPVNKKKEEIVSKGNITNNTNNVINERNTNKTKNTPSTRGSQGGTLSS